MISVLPIFLKNSEPVRVNPLALLVIPVMTCVAENYSVLITGALLEALRKRLGCFFCGWSSLSR